MTAEGSRFRDLRVVWNVQTFNLVGLRHQKYTLPIRCCSQNQFWLEFPNIWILLPFHLLTRHWSFLCGLYHRNLIWCLEGLLVTSTTVSGLCFRKRRDDLCAVVRLNVAAASFDHFSSITNFSPLFYFVSKTVRKPDISMLYDQCTTARQQSCSR